MFKKNTIVMMGAFLFMIASIFSAQASDRNLVAQNKKEITRYASFSAKGNGSGDSDKNAADFLRASFWEEVNGLLQKQPVKVLFGEGDYYRAYTEKPLVLSGMGNAKNLLTIEGVPNKTVFTADPTKLTKDRSVMFDIRNSQNIHVKNLYFSGNGRIGYVLRITSTKGSFTKNILIENCQWEDMRGIIYGTTGVHQRGTSHVTYKNCTFKRVGIDSHSHHIYNAYNPSYINVIDSHFEDCTGDFVRFRDNTDFCVIKGSTFVRSNDEFDRKPYPFISMPNFNKARTESFASNYVIVDNTFINKGSNTMENAIALHHYGYDRPGFNYLLTKEEGNILVNGSIADKKQLLAKNFGIKADSIRVYNNTYTGKIKNKLAVGSFARYGAVSKGWIGFGDIYATVKESNVPYQWEKPNK